MVSPMTPWTVTVFDSMAVPVATSIRSTKSNASGTESPPAVRTCQVTSADPMVPRVIWVAPGKAPLNTRNLVVAPFDRYPCARHRPVVESKYSTLRMLTHTGTPMPVMVTLLDSTSCPRDALSTGWKVNASGVVSPNSGCRSTHSSDWSPTVSVTETVVFPDPVRRRKAIDVRFVTVPGALV
jgi:hypothetical protein